MMIKRAFPVLIAASLVFANSFSQTNPWKTDGNANTSPTDFIGTIDARPIDFRTNNNTIMKIGVDGSVRVATLTGNGPSLVGADANGTLLRIGDPGVDSLAACAARLWDGDGNYITPNCFLGTTNGTALRLFTDSLERMRVSRYGDVGIGTTDPKSTFQVGEEMPFGISYRGPGPAGIEYLLGFNARLDGTTMRYVDQGFASYLQFDPVNGRFTLGMAQSGVSGSALATGSEMTLSKTGQCGIGTREPSAKLHVFEPGGAAELRIESGDPLDFPKLSLWSGPFSSNGGIFLGGITGAYDQQNVRTEFSIQVNSGGSLNPEATVLRMSKDEAEISTPLGIGRVADAQDMLSVLGVARFGTVGNQAKNLRIGHDGTDGLLQLVGNQPGRLKISGGDVQVMDRLGIGTNSFVDGSRNYRLSVDGHIRARAARVYPGWSDYVFEEGYELMPLAEVGAFIAENGHLPGVPSAEEVERDGVDVGETEALLLAKIEELTLHVIRLEAELERVKEREGGNRK